MSKEKSKVDQGVSSRTEEELNRTYQGLTRERTADDEEVAAGEAHMQHHEKTSEDVSSAGGNNEGQNGKGSNPVRNPYVRSVQESRRFTPTSFASARNAAGGYVRTNMNADVFRISTSGVKALTDADTWAMDLTMTVADKTPAGLVAGNMGHGNIVSIEEPTGHVDNLDLGGASIAVDEANKFTQHVEEAFGSQLRAEGIGRIADASDLVVLVSLSFVCVLMFSNNCFLNYVSNVLRQVCVLLCF